MDNNEQNLNCCPHCWHPYTQAGQDAAKRTYDFLMAHGPKSRDELADALGISFGDMAKVLISVKKMAPHFTKVEALGEYYYEVSDQPRWNDLKKRLRPVAMRIRRQLDPSDRVKQLAMGA